MKNFLRAFRFAWAYRGRLFVSVACALFAAVFWGLNFTAIYPVLKILGSDKNLQEWIDSEIQRSQDHSASTEYGRLIVPPGADDSHVIRGNTLQELADAIAARLEMVSPRTGGLRLAPGFLENLRSTVARFNGLATKGVDEDFHRGETAVQQLFNGPVKEEPGRTNPTMWPRM